MNPGSVAPDVTPLALVVSPSERLAMSRERLRQAMRPKRAADSPRAARGAGSPGVWLGSLKAHPIGAILFDAVTHWWSHHPLRLASMVAADATSAVVRPMAQRNPIALVLGALVVGGLMAWSRPWRWLLTPALLAGLVPRIFSKAMAMVPPQSWMAMLAALTQDDRQPTTSSAQAPQTAPPGQSPETAPAARAAGPAPDRSQCSGVGSKNE
jgi:hypothetical protein